MKTKSFFIALVAMLLVEVQGYAQPRYRHHYPRPHRVRVYAPVVPYHRVYSPLYVWYPSRGYYYSSRHDTYLYGSTSRPIKVRIKDMEFKRTSSGRLRIKNGKEPAVYLDTYKYNKVGYGDGQTHIVIETEGGNATIQVLDNNKQVVATYTL
jgi:hypothetical protein